LRKNGLCAENLICKDEGEYGNQGKRCYSRRKRGVSNDTEEDHGEYRGIPGGRKRRLRGGCAAVGTAAVSAAADYGPGFTGAGRIRPAQAAAKHGGPGTEDYRGVCVLCAAHREPSGANGRVVLFIQALQRRILTGADASGSPIPAGNGGFFSSSGRAGDSDHP